ncbi:TonB-dependent receptor [Segetibacter koreensis]|uniref:TonB-dependent receptor n=1 Tax=Segetibacter koreensis TaxID=398037 RepID=UPI00037A914C|nr:TonB-dependent receptor [Segetibacter koreensis]
MKNFIFLFSVSFLIIIPSLSFSQSSGKGVLTGTVTDEDGYPLAGASVFFHDVNTGAITDAKGKYSTAPINRGNYLVEVTFQGYSSVIVPITLNGNTTHNFTLKTTAVEQEAVTVTGVSSATRLRNSPQPVSVVKRTDLLQNASTNLVNALSRKGGVSVITTGPAISKPVIRGLSSNRVVTINDGIRQEGQQWGDEHGIEIDEYSVQKAEVLKGPASLMYGSDGIAGVINFITNQPVTAGTVKGNLLAAYNGNNNTQGFNGSLAGNLLNGFNWNMYGSLKSAGDYANKYDGRVLNSRFNEKNWGGYVGINKSWGYSHLLVSSFNQKLGLTEGVRDSATGKFLYLPETPYEAIATDELLKSKDFIIPYQHVQHFKIALDNSIASGRNRIVTTVAFQRNQRREFGNPDEPSTPGLHFDLKTINYNLQYQMAARQGWKTTIGANGMYQQNRNLAQEKLIPEYNLFDAGVFVYTTKSFNKLTFSGGLRGDMRKMDIKGLQEMGHSKFTAANKNFGNISGSAGVAYEASDKVTLKANIARGYRSPNAAELSSNGAHEGTYRYEYGDNTLKTENSLQFDGGVDIISRHVSFGISTFYNHISNYIYYSRLEAANGGDSLIVNNGTTLQAFKFSQSGASLAGFEANFDIHPHPLDWLHFENTFSYVAGTFNRSFEGSNRLPAMPPAHLLSELRANFAKVGTVLRNLYFKAEMDATAKQNRVFTAYNTETPTAGYALFDIGAGSDFNTKNGKLFSLYLSLNNITDVAYQSHLSRLKYTDVNNVTGRQGVFNMGRNFNVKLNIPFDFKQ